MSTTTNTSPGVATSTSLASSVTFRTFATVFAIAAPVIYTICEMRNWPLFTYHPGTNRIDLFWAAAVSFHREASPRPPASTEDASTPCLADTSRTTFCACAR